MNHNRFWGRNMSEALRAVRTALGTDALIVATKSLSKDLGGGVEITAATESAAPQYDHMPPVKPLPNGQNHPIDELRQELSSLKSMLGWLAPGLAHQDKIVKTLARQGVAAETVARLCAAAQQFQQSSKADERECWYRAITAAIPIGGAIRAKRERLALVGPAGVGKTATLIKLTVFETQRHACRVGWINTNERSLAAGDPLAVYSGILGAQYERATNRKELQDALQRMAECELILLDTPGVNPRDRESVTELAQLLQYAPDVRRLLLLNAATNGSDLCEWVAIFRQAGVYALLFTKLDECRYFGALLNTILAAELPVSYVTMGQNFAGDIAIAKPEVFSSLLLTGDDFDA